MVGERIDWKQVGKPWVWPWLHGLRQRPQRCDLSWLGSLPCVLPCFQAQRNPHFVHWSSLALISNNISQDKWRHNGIWAYKNVSLLPSKGIVAVELETVPAFSSLKHVDHKVTETQNFRKAGKEAAKQFWSKPVGWNSTKATVNKRPASYWDNTKPQTKTGRKRPGRADSMKEGKHSA